MGFKEIRKKMQWLDPFTYVDRLVIARTDNLGKEKKHAIFLFCLLFLAAAFLGLVPMAANALPLLVVLIAILGIFYYSNRKEGLDWAIYISFAFAFAWILFTGIGLLLGTNSPMVIVLSGSMEPLYHRGDVIILQGTDAAGLQGKEVQLNRETLAEVPLSSFAELIYSDSQEPQIEKISFPATGQTVDITKQGSIVVYWSLLRKQPIIHRVVAKLHVADGTYVLTKGDSIQNSTIDQDCGPVDGLGRPSKNCIQLYPVKVEELQGKAVLQIPFVGCFKLWLLDDLGSLITKGRLPSDFSGIC